MKFIVKLLIIFVLINSSIDCYSQGKIDKSKDELKKGKEEKPTYYVETETKSNEDEPDNLIVEILTEAFLYITYYSFIGNYEAEYHLQNELTEYPYFNNELQGNYLYDYSEKIPDKPIRLDIQNDLLLSLTNTQGNNLKAKFRPSRYFYLQGDYIQLIEFNTVSGSNSYLSIFSLNFGYDRLRFEKFNLGWTIGANYVGNGVDKFGFNYGLNTEFFLIKNLSFYGSMRLGEINNVSVNVFELKAKYHKNRFAYSVGYENLKIGSPIYNFGTLGLSIYF